MRSNAVPAPTPAGMQPVALGPGNTIDRLRSRDHLESMARLRAAVHALDEVDITRWDDPALAEHLDEISAILCAIDTQLARVADAVRDRGFRIAEPLAA
jgi:hypothetical protein